MRLLLRPILGQYDASRRPNDRVSHECHSAHCVVHGFPILFAYRPKPHPSLVKLARLVRKESCWKTRGTALFAAISQVSTWYLCASGRCVGVRQAIALIGNARQATSEGKSGPVETGLTGPAATALHHP